MTSAIDVSKKYMLTAYTESIASRILHHSAHLSAFSCQFARAFPNSVVMSAILSRRWMPRRTPQHRLSGVSTESWQSLGVLGRGGPGARFTERSHGTAAQIALVGPAARSYIGNTDGHSTRRQSDRGRRRSRATKVMKMGMRDDGIRGAGAKGGGKKRTG